MRQTVAEQSPELQKQIEAAMKKYGAGKYRTAGAGPIAGEAAPDLQVTSLDGSAEFHLADLARRPRRATGT